MLALTVWCGRAINKYVASSSRACRIEVRTELNNKHAGYIELPSGTGVDLSVNLQRQCALVLTEQIPFGFLRVKFHETQVSPEFFENQALVFEDTLQCLRALSTTCLSTRPMIVPTLRVCWEQDKYKQACNEMMRYCTKFEVCLNECKLTATLQGSLIGMPVNGFFYGLNTLVLHMQCALVDGHTLGKQLALFNPDLKVLRLRGGVYSDGWDYYLPHLKKLEELDIDEPFGVDEFWLTSTTLKRLRLSKFKLEQVPKVIQRMVELVELDLSNNDLESIPDWICTLYNLQGLILHNNLRLNKLPDIYKLKKLTRLDVSFCNFTTDLLDILTLCKSLQVVDYSNNPRITRHQQPRSTLCIQGTDNVLPTS